MCHVCASSWLMDIGPVDIGVCPWFGLVSVYTDRPGLVRTKTGTFSSVNWFNSMPKQCSAPPVIRQQTQVTSRPWSNQLTILLVGI